MPNTPIQAASEAMPEISKVILGTNKPESIHRLTVDELRKLSMEELRALLHVISAIDEIVCAFLNQGRFSNGNNYNEAGELADSLLDHFSWCIAMIEQVAKQARPSTSAEAKQRAWLLIQRAAHYSDVLPDFVAAAAKLSVEASHLEDA